jgi:hypothetical protein
LCYNHVRRLRHPFYSTTVTSAQVDMVTSQMIQYSHSHERYIRCGGNNSGDLSKHLQSVQVMTANRPRAARLRVRGTSSGLEFDFNEFVLGGSGGLYIAPQSSWTASTRIRVILHNLGGTKDNRTVSRLARTQGGALDGDKGGESLDWLRAPSFSR